MEVKVITVPEATERQEAVTKEMNKTGLDWEFVYAKPSDEVNSNQEGWTTGANSLRLTTIDIVSKAKDDLWIWEDDSVVNEKYLKQVISQLDKLESFDFIHFNYSGGKFYDYKNIGPFRKTLDGVYCCQSYIINRNVFKDYQEELKKNEPIDSGTKRLHQKRRNSYVVEPAPVTHFKNKYSYIRNKIVNY